MEKIILKSKNHLKIMQHRYLKKDLKHLQRKKGQLLHAQQLLF